MPWFKVDDTLHSHPKSRGASLSAMGLWALCGSYSMSYKLDGFVPAWFAHSFPNGKKLSAELVRVGLWNNAIRQSEDGYQFHDWGDYQPSAEEIEAEREAARKRQRAFREKRRQARDGERDAAVSHISVTRDVTRDKRRESRHPVPTRPDPARPALYRTTRVETSHHGVGLGNAGASDVMMPATRQEIAS